MCGLLELGVTWLQDLLAFSFHGEVSCYADGFSCIWDVCLSPEAFSGLSPFYVFCVPMLWGGGGASFLVLCASCVCTDVSFLNWGSFLLWVWRYRFCHCFGSLLPLYPEFMDFFAWFPAYGFSFFSYSLVEWSLYFQDMIFCPCLIHSTGDAFPQIFYLSGCSSIHLHFRSIFFSYVNNYH